jgi:beta-xylosidase
MRRWGAGLALVTALLGGMPLAGIVRGDGRQVPALPRLGTPQVVDRDDVGDPFILSVPAGIAPPADLVDESRTTDARLLWSTAAWTAASAAAARAHGWYVLFDTTDWRSNVPAALSTDLIHWSTAPDALPVLPAWAARTVSMTWAPAAQAVHAGWVLYFSTEDGAMHVECIGAATARVPTGPYVDRSPDPLVCQPRQGGSIDPSVVHGPRGRTFLVWKNDGNHERLPDAIWSAPLRKSGLALAGRPTRLLSASEPWDHGIVEAPAMIPARSGGWWLFYAAGRWDSDSYATGLAYCRSMSAACRPTSEKPFLSTTTSMVSPGTLDTVTAHDGQLWAAWTALQPEHVRWARDRTWYDRVLEIAPVLRH